ncbi:MAG TPA: hypothetical protein VEG60_33085 [Candidatus Binatia bacterium]|nr:hypothetical protein [Candidatus Binatia bacterium]
MRRQDPALATIGFRRFGYEVFEGTLFDLPNTLARHGEYLAKLFKGILYSWTFGQAC